MPGSFRGGLWDKGIEQQTMAVPQNALSPRSLSKSRSRHPLATQTTAMVRPHRRLLREFTWPRGRKIGSLLANNEEAERTKVSYCFNIESAVCLSLGPPPTETEIEP